MNPNIERTLFGSMDNYVKIIERALNVTFINRNGRKSRVPATLSRTSGETAGLFDEPGEGAGEAEAFRSGSGRNLRA